MATPFTIDLTINLPGGGRLAKQLLNIYFDDMPADINQTAYQLCEANKTSPAQKFTGLTLKRAEVWPEAQGGLKVFALFSVSGEDSAFIQNVLAAYIDGFPDYLRSASEKNFSRSGAGPDIPLQPTDWNAEVKAA